ncbi:uncharacterized protein KZ484_001833 [Pholidichthys leucotaenia]
MVFDWKRGRENVFLYDESDQYNNGRLGQEELFHGRVFHFPEKTKNGNASIVIMNTKVEDSGNYTCLFPHHHPRKRSIVELIVVIGDLRDRSAENIPGPAEMPRTAILDATDKGVPLICYVCGVPPGVKLEWRDGNGTVLQSESPQASVDDCLPNVSLLTHVNQTSTGPFYCYAQQDAIGHTVRAKLSVPKKMFEKGNASEPISGQNWVVWCPGGVTVALIIGVVLGLNLHFVFDRVVAVFRNCLRIYRRRSDHHTATYRCCGRSEEQQDNVKISVPESDTGISDSLPTKGPVPFHETSDEHVQSVAALTREHANTAEDGQSGQTPLVGDRRSDDIE